MKIAVYVDGGNTGCKLTPNASASDNCVWPYTRANSGIPTQHRTRMILTCVFNKLYEVIMNLKAKLEAAKLEAAKLTPTTRNPAKT